MLVDVSLHPEFKSSIQFSSIFLFWMLMLGLLLQPYANFIIYLYRRCSGKMSRHKEPLIIFNYRWLEATNTHRLTIAWRPPECWFAQPPVQLKDKIKRKWWWNLTSVHLVNYLLLSYLPQWPRKCSCRTCPWTWPRSDNLLHLPQPPSQWSSRTCRSANNGGWTMAFLFHCEHLIWIKVNLMCGTEKSHAAVKAREFQMNLREFCVNVKA